jgi:signal transduction histidine kinase/CheY-like chemotaxis protein
MSGEKIVEYLSGFVNRAESHTELLHLFLSATKSSASILFVRDRGTDHYTCMATTFSDTRVKFVPVKEPNIVVIGSQEELSDITYNVRNSMRIPVMNLGEQIGLLFLLNRQEGFSEELLTVVTPLLGLLQLVTKSLSSNITKSHDCKDLFMANMSHEIRTPLNGVIGYNQLLMQTNLTATQKNYLSSMRQCSIQLMQIINDILDFFKLSSGTMKEDIESFRANEIVQAVNDALDQSLRSKKQSFTYQIDDTVPTFLVMDKRKLIQIVMNLVSNAHKFTPISGAIMLYITCQSSGLLEIRVSDNGIGIAKEDQGKIFRAFEQVQGGASRIGTGLGLAICRKLSNFMGGCVRVQSTVGKGSTFTVTACFKDYEDFAQETKKDISMLRNKKILVVDDNTNNRILLGETLFGWDMEPVVCASAVEALRMVQAKRSDGSHRHTFELGLVDICMPNTGGIELAKQIKQDLPLLPLIALSSVDSFILTEDFESKLDKPIDKIQLLTHICRVLGNRENPPAFIGDIESQRPPSSAPSSKFNKDVRILIAEDIMYNSSLLVTMLESMGYWDITTSFNGQDAITKLTHAHDIGNNFEILLLDLRMPEKDGYDVIEEHRKQGWKLPKIIVVTASIMDQDREKCKSVGVEYFLNKPIEMSQLSDTMLYVSEMLG